MSSLLINAEWFPSCIELLKAGLIVNEKFPQRAPINALQTSNVYKEMIRELDSSFNLPLESNEELFLINVLTRLWDSNNKFIKDTFISSPKNYGACLHLLRGILSLIGERDHKAFEDGAVANILKDVYGTMTCPALKQNLKRGLYNENMVIFAYFIWARFVFEGADWAK